MNPSIRKFLPPISAGLLLVTVFTGCETAGESALLGAAAGAAIGGAAEGTGRGAIRGAAIGAGAGYLIGRLAERDRYEDGYYEDDYDRGPYRASRSVERRYPVGRPTGRRGFVTSPYAPNHVIDVRDIPRGARVIDPSVNRVFINP